MNGLPGSDPRVFFAAERTLLAWVRTGIAIIGLGFVVAKFGLFVRLLTLQSQALGHHAAGSDAISAVLGIGFVLMGSLAMIAAAVQHHRFVATLPMHDLPAGYSKRFTVWLTLVVAVLGVCLAGYLFAS